MKPRQARGADARRWLLASCASSRAKTAALVYIACCLLCGLHTSATAQFSVSSDNTFTFSETWISQNTGASVSSTAPPNATNMSVPLYGDGTVPGVSLKGIYCVDTVRRTAYVGADVVTVFRIDTKVVPTTSAGDSIDRQAQTGSRTDYILLSTESDTANTTSAYFFTQVGQLVLDGWATACIFANRYELFLSVVNGSTSQRKGAVNAGASRMHYAVVHRYLRTLLRTLPLPETAADQAVAAASAFASAPESSSSSSVSSATEHAVSVGPSELLRRNLVTSVTSIVTPYWQGYLAVHHLASPFVSTWTVRVAELATLLAVTRTGAGDGGGSSAPMLFAIGFAPIANSDGSPPSHAQLADAWDIVGVSVDAVIGNADPADIVPPLTSRASRSAMQPPAGPSSEYPTLVNGSADGTGALPQPNATVQPVERLARCYRAAVQADCPDCVPVALTHSRSRLFVVFVGYQEPYTCLVSLPIHTPCTMGTADESTSAPAASSASASSSSSGTDGVGIKVYPILHSACNVSGLVADGYAPSRVLLSTTCPYSTNVTVSQIFMVRVAAEAWSPEATTQANALQASVTDVRRIGPMTFQVPGSNAEAIVRLTFANETQLAHLALRRSDGAVTLLTYAAFGIVSSSPQVVDAAGGSRLTLTGYGMVPGMRCVFAGALGASTRAFVVSDTTAICTAPPLSQMSCVRYQVGLQMSYEDVPWALPSAAPRNSVLSTAAIMLVQLTSPSVDRAVLEETGESYALSGTNATVLVDGKGLASAIVAAYPLPNTRCRFWSPNAPEASVTVMAYFKNTTTVACPFEEIPMLPPPSYISLSNDGTVFTRRGAPFASFGDAVAVELEVLPRLRAAAGKTSGGNSSSDIAAMSVLLPGILASMPTTVSSPRTLLPTIRAFLIDNVSHHVPLPAGSEGALLARMYVASYGRKQAPAGAAVNGSPTGSSASDISASLEGTHETPFDANGAASFEGLTFHCPPVGVATLCVAVVNTSSGSPTPVFEVGCVEVHIVEGPPHALTFVQKPSATYYPDWPLLSRQPIIGLQDVCLNVLSSVSDATLPGDVTLQLYAEPMERDGGPGLGHSASAVPYGPAWTAGSPIQNLFYVTNLSMPVAAFDTRYYLTVSADLPQPQTWSTSIEMLACESGRRSVLHPATGTTASATSSNTDSSGDGEAARQQIQCDPCPAHGVCDGTSKVVVEDGYWRANATSVDFVYCRLGHGALEACANDGRCSAGYEGPLCGTCAEGYHTMGRFCRKCLSRGVQNFVTVLVAVAALAGLTSIVVGLAVIPPSPVLVVASRTLLLSVQVLSLFSYTTFDWPATLNFFFNGLNATADFIASLMSCYLRPSGILVLLCCTPLVFIPLVTLLAGLWLRLLRRHRIRPASMCAVVLTALLHRKQERFHVLRHTVARELWEPSSGCDTRPSTNSANDPRGLHSPSSRRTEGTPSGEWTASGADPAQSTTLASSLPVHAAALQASLLMGSTICADSAAAPASVASTSMDGSAEDMEAFVLAAFGRRATRAVSELMARQPGVSQERVVAAAIQAGDATLFEAVSKMSVALPTRAQVRRWTGCALDVVACLPPAGVVRHETMSPLTKSGSGSPDATAAADAAGEGKLRKTEAGDGSESRAMVIRWRRVGMIAAYRAMAVEHFRTSWVALLLSATSVTMVCLYLNLFVHALLWQRCVSLGDSALPFDDANAIPINGAPVLCNSDEYRAMRKLGIAMIAVYGIAVPLGFGVVAMFLKQRYGEDVAHAALPVMFFGDTSLDLLVSLSDFTTKCVSTIAVAVARTPLLQMGVLIAVFGNSLVVNSLWRAEGHFFEMRIWVFSVALRRVITAARIVMFVVSNVLLLLAYLMISDGGLSARAQRGFTALVCTGVILAIILFFVVSLHQLILHLGRMREIRALAERRESAERLALQRLIQRYRDVTRTIELYLQACDRGLLVAQKLDSLSRMPAVGDEDVGGGGGGAAAAASGADDGDGDGDDDPLSFSSLPNAAAEGGTESPHPSRHSTPPTSVTSGGGGGGDGAANAPSTPHRPRRGSRRRRHHDAPLSDDSLSDSRTSATARPEALTHFPSYPELDFSDTTSRSTLAPSVVSDATASRAARARARDRRRHAKHLSGAFRSLGPSSRRRRVASTAVVVTPGESEGPEPSAYLDLLSLIHPAAADAEAAKTVEATYAAGTTFCEPVDGNAYWVSPDSRGDRGIQAAEDRVDATAGGEPPTATAAPTPSPNADAGAAPNRRTSGAAEAPARRDDPASPMRDADGHATAAAVTAAAATASTAGGPHTNEGRAIPVAVTNPLPAAATAAVSSAAATAVPPSAWSAALAEVPVPAARPALRRSDSLVLSIRSLETAHVRRAQAALAALMEESRAVAARLGSASDPATTGTDSGDGGGSGGGGGGGGPSATPSARGQQLSTDAAALIDHYGAGGGLELDLASSFDTLAVPPLPLTRALTRTVAVGSDSVGARQRDTGAGPATSLLAALQCDMDSQLRLFHAVDVQDGMPELDLGSLADAASLLQQLGVPGVALAGGGGGGGSAPSSPPNNASTPRPRPTRLPTAGRSAAAVGAAGSPSATTTTATAAAAAPAAAAAAGTGAVGGAAVPGSDIGLTRPHGAGPAAAAGEGAEGGGGTAPPLPVFRAVSQRPQRHHATAAALPARRRPHRTHAGAADGTRSPAAPSQTAASGTAVRGGASPSSVEVQEPSMGKRARKP